MSTRRKNVLIIGMADSIHVARWIAQFRNLPINFTIFPSSPHRRIHPLLAQFITSTSGDEMTVAIRPAVMRWAAFVLSAIDIPLRNFLRGRLLRHLLAGSNFDVIHVLEFQHAGYLLLDAKTDQIRSKVILTNWGSDIYWFQKFPRHRLRIEQLLKIADEYSAECQRDIDLVRAMGYTGKVLPLIPNSGGIDPEGIPKPYVSTSQRNKIMVKGYTGFVGRALTALTACELAADYLKGYQIIVYSASLRARLYLIRLRRHRGLDVTRLKKRTPHREMLRYFSEARVYLGVSLSDGIGTSLLEAMATGCYPIQTDTSCAHEWISADSGSLVPPHDISRISRELIVALTDDQRVNSASQINMATIASRATVGAVAAKAHSFYEFYTEK